MPRSTRTRSFTAKTADPAKVKKVLNYIKAQMHAQTGDDDDPSEVWKALLEFEDVDPEGAEIAQDSLLLGQDFLQLAIDNIGDDGSFDKKQFGTDAIMLVLGFIPEIKSDIEDALEN
tara:strand:+ start:123 stop:473 length:351 start_codon:yes stop_codon:yes gene_type:complete